LTSIFLSWNRPHLLEKAIDSYNANTTVDHEVFLVDNASDGATKKVIKAARRAGKLDRAVFLRRNIGGLALNRILPEAKGRFIHFSENDFEYFEGWDKAALRKFEAFPKLGQMGLMSPWPKTGEGEIWGPVDIERLESGGEVIYKTPCVSTTSVIRREIIDSGLVWDNYVVEGRFRLPNDWGFSGRIAEMGYLVAWPDEHLAQTWGHNVAEFEKDVEYYIENYANKSWLGADVFDRRLAELGYQLVFEGGKWQIQRRSTGEFIETGPPRPPRFSRITAPARRVRGTMGRRLRALKPGSKG
jgi:glycosyltransferase involved in cell wall biosynthesis